MADDLKLPVKSYLKFSKKKFWKFFCPNCKVERRVPVSPNPWRFKYFFRIAIATAFTMLLLWDYTGWKGVVVFLPYWMVFEVTFRLWVRSKLPCDQCGFDPYLFIQDKKLAHEEIAGYWKTKFKEKGIPYPGEDPSPESMVGQEDVETTESIQDLDKSIDEAAQREDI